MSHRFACKLYMGSFPYALCLPGTGREVREYLTGPYNTVLLKNVATRARKQYLSSQRKYYAVNLALRNTSAKVAATTLEEVS